MACRVTAAAVLAVALASVLMLCSCQQARLKRVRVEAPPVGVKVMIVSQSGNVSQRSYVGKVQSAKAASITSLAAGTIEKMTVVEGTRLKEGDVIAVINSSAVLNALAAAQATLSQAEDGLKRTTQLFQNGTIPEVKLVEVQTKYAQAKASLDAARSALDDCTVRAPYACSVVSVSAHRGERVAPGQILVSVMDENALEVVIPVPEAELAGIPVGAGARVVFPSIPAADEFERSFPATVRSKALVSNDLSHTFKCTLKLRRMPGGVTSGMACKVYLDQDNVKGIVVPSDIVKMDDGGLYVWTVAGGVVNKTRVTVGGYSGRGVIVDSGLMVGDMIVTEGASKVCSGMKVNVQ